MSRDTGVIKKGARADLVTLDTQIAELSSAPKDSLLDAAIFAANDNPVSDVMVNGVWQIKDKQHDNYEMIRTKYKSLLKRKVNVL